MRSLSGFLLLTAGLTVGAFAYYPGNGPERDLAEITRIMTPGAAPSAAGVAGSYTSTPRLFSPQSPLIALDDPTRIASLEHKSAQAERAKPSVADEAGAWSTVMTPAPAASTPHHRLSSTRPADDATRDELVRDLQRELKRVGCYHGEVDGDWGPGSKRAMSSFIERVNATLPTSEPDYILLMLVQGQTQPACGNGCPSGQVAGDEGRCIPKAIVAHAQTKPVIRSTRLERETTPSQPAPAAEAETTVVPVEHASAAAAAALSDPLAPKPARRMVTLVAKPSADLAAETATVPVTAREPLPGRMTVGAPMPSAEAPAELTSKPRPARHPVTARAAVAEPISPPDTTEASATSENAAPRRPGKSKRARHAQRRNNTAAWSGPPPKRKYSYASGPSRGGARPGTPRFNLLLSLGGVF